jgi:hypothetical protein
MVPRIALSRANWRDATRAMIYDAVSVVGNQDGTLTVRRGAVALAHVAVTAVEREAVATWKVTTDSGEVFYVERVPGRSGCGCGR